MRIAELRKLFISQRGYVLLALHLSVFAFSYWLAYGLRFDFDVPPESLRLFWATLPWVLAIKLVTAYLSGTFHGWLRYATFHDMMALARAAAAAFLVIIAVDHFLLDRVQIPRSVVLLDALLSLLLLGGLRAVGRVGREHVWPLINMHVINRNAYRRALLVGAGANSISLIGQIHAHPSLAYRVVGLLDTNSDLLGTRLAGVPVVGSPDMILALAESYDADEVLLVDGSLPGKQLRPLMETCRNGGLALKVLPNFNNALGFDPLMGPHGLRLRDVDINDVLRRDPVALDDSAVAEFLTGRVVMVTGAGGSIGSEICRQVLRFGPKALILVERSENNLFQIDRDLRSVELLTNLVPCLADVADTRRMQRLFEDHRPHVVFHAAAHKHVPMMEFNPGEAIKNNLFGTRVVADLADEYQAESFVLISTDKAVNPTSMMGLSKQLAERYVYALSQASASRFVAVRFGNVLGSAGSVVPIFQEQIRKGGPITITHPEMRRYFMTIPEASQLVLQAGAMGRGGEVFVLDMGEPVRIVDLATDLIRLSGLEPDEIEIRYTGIRPGEKLFEELYLDEEQTLPTPHPKLRVAFQRPYTMEEVRELLDEMGRLVNEDDPHLVRRRLAEIVPEYAEACGRHQPAVADQPSNAHRPSNGSAGGPPMADVPPPASILPSRRLS